MGKQMSLSEAIDASLDGNAVLFLGAGFSRTATNVGGSTIKTGKELAGLLVASCGVSEEVSLDDAAALFVERNGREALVRLLMRELQVREVRREHLALAGVPWRRVYTTNYDEVMELSARQCGLAMSSVCSTDDTKALASHPSVCVHINVDFAYPGNGRPGARRLARS